MIINPQDIKKAVAAISEGGVIAYPTEAVWGLGCNPKNEAAVTRLLSIKKRAVTKGLILVAASIEQFIPLLGQLTNLQYQTLETNWPGFTTYIVPASASAPAWIKGDSSHIALRVSAHPTVQALCQTLGGPLVSTSANKTGQPPARHFKQVVTIFSHELAFILPGKVGGEEKPSPIIDMTTYELLR